MLAITVTQTSARDEKIYREYQNVSGRSEPKMSTYRLFEGEKKLFRRTVVTM